MNNIIEKIKKYKRVLIEASAGTGKTYTLEYIILNLLSTKLYLPSEILVLTFTKKATKEMKERILNLLDLAYENSENDENLKYISENSNKISISTIHKFALNSLNRFQDENGNFSNLMVKDTFKAEIEDIVYEFLRRSNSLAKKLKIPIEEFEIFKNNFTNTEKLLGYIKDNYRRNKVEELKSWIEKQKSFELQLINKNILIESYNKIINEINQLTPEEREILFKKHRGVSSKSNIDFKIIYEKENCLGKIIKNLEEDKFLSKIRKGNIKNSEELSKNENELKRELENLSTNLKFEMVEKSEKNYLKEYLKLKVLYKILSFIEEELEKLIETSNLIDQNHLIKRFLNFLEKDETLKNKLKNKHKIILIDEAQDIDREQIKIFNILSEHNMKLLFISDPKQIIYSFRNSDISLYNKEIKDKTNNDAKINLSTNYRASKKIMNGVNKIFSLIYNHAITEEVEKIEYISSNTDPKNDNNEIYLNENSITSINIINEKENILKEIALTIKYLLQNGELKTLNGVRKIKENDIKILCRTKAEVESIGKALLEENINVFKSGNSLIESKEFKEVFYIIRCFSKTRNFEDVNYVLASKIINLPWNFIVYIRESNKINEIEEFIGELINSLQNNEISLKNAILKFESEINLLFLTLLKDHGYVESNKDTTSYRECLIAEKRIKELKNYEDSLDFVSSLYYNEKNIESLINEIEDLILENDEETEVKNEYTLENTVEVLTIHKSKGLSFNIVFLVNQKDLYKSLKHDFAYKFYKGNEINYDFFRLKENKEKAYKKLFNEEKNMLYVGLTRARYGIFILNKGKLTKELLENANIENIEEIEKDFNIAKLIEKIPFKLNSKENNDGISLKDPDEINKNLLRQERVFSYSKLTKKTNNTYLLNTENEKDDDDEYYIDNEENPLSKKENVLPKGKHFGKIFHEVMEKVNFKDAIFPFEEFSQINLELVKEKIKIFDINFNKEEVQIELLNMVYNVLNSNISPDNFKLSEIEELNKEIEFQIKINHKKTTLSDSYLKGIIDLVIKINNKIYIVDYKTNYLGSSEADYNKDNLEYVMKKENYDTQYRIYSLGLKKIFFKDEKSYDENFGGIIYIFTRAFTNKSDTKNGIFYFKPSLEELNTLENELKG